MTPKEQFHEFIKARIEDGRAVHSASLEQEMDEGRRLGLTVEEMRDVFRLEEKHLTDLMREARGRAEHHYRIVEGLNGTINVIESMGEIANMGIAQACDAIKAKMPALYKCCYPRKLINIPGGYGSPRSIVALAFNAMWHSSEYNPKEWKNDPPKDDSPRNEHLVKTISALIEKGVPTYFLSRSIAEALVQTDLPKDFSLSEMPWPMESMLFSLPDDMLVGKGFHISLLAVSKIEPRSYDNSWMKWGEGMEELVLLNPVRHDGAEMVTVLALANDGRLFQWQAPLDTASIYQASEVSIMGANLASFSKAPDEDLGENTIFTSQSIPRAAFQIILAMLAAPELIEAGTLIRSFKDKKRRQPSDAWHPNFFGRAYRRYENIVGEPSEHGPRRMHWRRGHFRHQRFGEGRRAIKVVWIKPILVGKAQLAA